VVSLLVAPVLALLLSVTPVEASTPDDRPPVTVSDFFPESENLSTCTGFAERPGCGSESRGGWRQTAVLAAILLGLVVVFGNVIRGVRRNRKSLDR